ncbi:MAG: hypothetical protein N4A50_10430 [Vallitalea sp.]|nr:hypothetical protein [Vallitalea sp.]
MIKIIWIFLTLSRGIEYCDENNKFHYTYWNEEDGKIGRSYRFDTRNTEKRLKMVSIIIDAKKEVII